MIQFQNINPSPATTLNVNVFLKSDSHLPDKFIFICFIDSPLKMIKNTFYFILKVFPFTKYLNFCLDILVAQKKRFNYENKISFKIFDATSWLTNNYNAHVAHYLTKLRQPDSEFGQVIQNIAAEILFFKIDAENEAGRLVLDLFVF